MFLLDLTAVIMSAARLYTPAVDHYARQNHHSGSIISVELSTTGTEWEPG